MSNSIGMNVGFLNISDPEFAFLNCVKMCDGWYPKSSGSVVNEFCGLYQNFLDSNGYVTTLSPGAPWTFNQVGFGSLFNNMPNLYPAGTYVFLWDNGVATAGAFTFSGDVSSTDTTNAASRRILLTVTTPSAVGISMQMNAAAISGANYPTNFRLVYGGNGTDYMGTTGIQATAGTGGSTTAGVNGTGTWEALLNSGEIFNPVWITRMQNFTAGIRVMDWMFPQATMQMVWADRRPQNYVFYADTPTSAKKWGGSPVTSGGGAVCDGVPAEVIFALANKLNVPVWVNMPAFASDDYIYQFAALAHSTLTTTVTPRIYVEYCNEPWNITNVASQFAMGVVNLSASGNQVTVNSITANPSQGGPPIIQAGVMIDDGGVNFPYPTLITGQVSGTAGGAGVYTINRTLGTVVSQSANIQFNVPYWMAQLAVNAFPGASAAGTSSNCVLYCTWRCTAMADLWNAAWGVDSGKVACVYNGQAANSSNTSANLTAVSGNGTVYSENQASFTGSISGATLTASSVTNTIKVGHSVQGAGVLSGTLIESQLTGTTGGAGTYQVNFSQPVSSEAMTSLYWSGTVASHLSKLAIAPYFATGYVPGVGATNNDVFTVILGTGTNSVTEALGWVDSNVTVANSNGLGLVGYEGGQSLVAAGNFTLFESCNTDTRMGTATTNLLNGWYSRTSGPLFYYQAIRSSSDKNYWGALEDLRNTTSAKWDALIAFVSSVLHHGGRGLGRF